jgi:isoleucyl-tRNA synthetase
VRYRAVADWAVLGRKLRANLHKVKNALPSLSSEHVKAYIDTGKITVAGIELIAGDLTVQRYIELPVGAEAQYATHTDADVVVRLDVQDHPELKAEWLARELINRVQKLRKKAGLLPTDDVAVFYAFEAGAGTDILAAMFEQRELLERTVRNVPVDVAGRKPNAQVLIDEEQEIADTKFKLSIVRL